VLAVNACGGGESLDLNLGGRMLLTINLKHVFSFGEQIPWPTGIEGESHCGVLAVAGFESSKRINFPTVAITLSHLAVLGGVVSAWL